MMLRLIMRFIVMLIFFDALVQTLPQSLEDSDDFDLSDAISSCDKSAELSSRDLFNNEYSDNLNGALPSGRIAPP